MCFNKFEILWRRSVCQVSQFGIEVLLFEVGLFIYTYDSCKSYRF